MMIPDFEKAALKATETILNHGISAAPVDPLPVLKTMKGVLVLSYAELSAGIGTERHHLISMFGQSKQDAFTSVTECNGKLRYVVVYNQRLPIYMIQRGLARELGHIVLNHDGSRPDEVRTDEALCFARYLLCPRPVIRAIQESEIPLTVDVVGTITGCYERCLAGIRKTPGAHIPPELNRAVKAQFADYLSNFIDFRAIVTGEDESPLADLGSFMDNYGE